MAARKLAFVIHDLNPWGGQDRSVLEVARRLSHRWSVEIHAYTWDDPLGREAWGDVTFVPVLPGITRPALAKFSWFHTVTAARLRGRTRPLVHATGACSLVSDVVQAQFVHAEWRLRRTGLRPGACEPAFARGAAGPRRWGRAAYQESLESYNLATERVAFTPAKKYVAISRGVADELARHFGVRGATVIHHGVDAALFRPHWDGGDASEREAIRAAAGATPSETLFVLVGAYERKGLAPAIEALARLAPAARAKARLLAVGGGAEAGFRALASRLGVKDRVSFVAPTREVARYYRAADAFLLPTFYEPFGLVILEAMASGLACVVSASAGASELLEDRVSAYLLRDPTDAAEIARAMEPLIEDAGLRRSFGERARAAAEARSWDRVAEEYAVALAPWLGGATP